MRVRERGILVYHALQPLVRLWLLQKLHLKGLWKIDRVPANAAKDTENVGGSGPAGAEFRFNNPWSDLKSHLMTVPYSPHR